MVAGEAQEAGLEGASAAAQRNGSGVDAGDVEMSVIPLGDDRDSANLKGRGMDGNSDGDGIHMADMSVDGVGQATVGLRVQRPEQGDTEGMSKCPEGASTGVKNFFSDASYYDEKSDNQAWTSRTTFILASIGCAVGIGNIWRFPYMCYRNGGAAFMIPYLVSVFTLGYPLFVLETSLGQGTGKSPVGALGALCPRLKGLAWLGFSANACITCYYMVVLSWTLKYLIACFTTGPLPFADGQAPYYFQHKMLDKTFLCEPPPNPAPDFEPMDNISPQRAVGWSQSRAAMVAGYECRDATFHDEGPLNLEQASLFLCIWAIVLGMVFAGTKSLKYSVYITLPLPYFVLVVMFFRGITLDGAADGIAYYVKPDLSVLFYDRWDESKQEWIPAINIWLSAASHIFYSLGLGQGMLITYSSYNPSHYPIRMNSLIVSAANSCTEMFGGFATFSILGYLAKQKGVPVDDVVAGGPGLVFESLPEAFGLMPAPKFFAFLFFFMLLLLGISSAIGMFESIVATVRNQLTDMAHKSPISRILVSRHFILPIVMSMVIGLPGLIFCRRSAEAWIDLVDGTVSFFLLSLIGVGEFVAVSWIFGNDNFSTVIEHRCGFKPDRYVRFVWKFWGPCLLMGLFLFGIAGAVKSPVTRVPWALAFGWLLAIIPLAFSIQYYIRSPNHDGEQILVKDSVRPKRQDDPTAPNYVRQPWKIIELFTAQGKDEMDQSGHPGQDAGQGTSMDDVTNSASKAAQKNPLLNQQNV